MCTTSEWDTDLNGLKTAMSDPAPTHFEGLPASAGYADGKKKLSVTAFLKFVQSQNLDNGKYKKELDMTPAAYAAFNKADADGDLHLDADEWKTLMANLRPNHDTKFNTWMESNHDTK